MEDFPYDLDPPKTKKAVAFIITFQPLDDVEVLSNEENAPRPEVNCTTELVVAELKAALDTLCLKEKLVITGISVVKNET